MARTNSKRKPTHAELLHALLQISAAGIHALFETHPDKTALRRAFQNASEHLIAAQLPSSLPDGARERGEELRDALLQVLADGGATPQAHP